MANFDSAVAKTLKFEGGYTNDPNDPGGPTNFGITLGVAQGLGEAGDFNEDGVVDTRDIQSMTVEDAKRVYKQLYWNGDAISSQAIAEKNFDMGVNIGVVTAAKKLQSACNVCGASLSEDGKIGPHSLQVINSIPETDLMTALCKVQANYYWEITAKDVAKNGPSRGWSPEFIASLLRSLEARDLPTCQEYLRALKQHKLKEGKLSFLNGWLKRAADRFSI